MAKRSGLKTAGLIAGIGCLSIIAIVVGGVIIASIWARATVANLGDPNPQHVERRIALPPPDASAARRPANGARTAPLRLVLELQEGFFTIRPGQPGTEIQVQGDYAPGQYELIESQETDPATGVRRATIRFRSKVPTWARFFSNIGGNDQNRPKITVIIPRGSPLDLSLGVTMGQSEVDLGGLTLGDVQVNASMGEHRIDFQEPVVEGIRSLRLNASMGNVIVDNLGNARAETISTSGSMGNLTANLGGAWPSGGTSNVTFEQSMGELTVRVPSNIRVDADIRNSSNQNARPPELKQPDDPNAPTLRMRVTTSMGNSRVIQY
jgi:hypothetical protein